MESNSVFDQKCPNSTLEHAYPWPSNHFESYCIYATIFIHRKKRRKKKILRIFLKKVTSEFGIMHVVLVDGKVC